MRNGAAKAVGIDVEKGKVGEQAELFGEETGDVGVVDVDAGDDLKAFVGWQKRAEDALVVTDIGSDPGPRQIHRIRDDRLLPCLESNVGVAEVGVWEG